MTYRQRLSLLLFIDTSIVLTAIFISSFLVNGTIHVITFPIIIGSLTILLSHHLLAISYKLYKKAWEYASIGELLIIFKIVTYSIMLTALIQQVVLQEVHYRLLAVTWMLHMLFIGGSRFLWRMYRDSFINKDGEKKRTLIVGAGSAGTMVARQLLQSNEGDLLPIAFIDDNVRKQHLDILGIPVIGGIEQIEKVVNDLAIENVIIAIPSLSKRELNKIFQECAKTKAKTQTLPRIEDLVTGKLSVNHFRDVQVEDLLGRDPVELNMDSISEYVTNKIILVTGAGGSIGSEISRQIYKFKPKQLILLGHGENSIYSIEIELKDTFKDTEIEFITEIADLQDPKKMMTVMSTYRPDVVYHAAAHKHVPLMEDSPMEAIKNNVFGTYNVADCAHRFKAERFVLISTDKAVNPTNIMGATKRMCEMIIQSIDKVSETSFVAVRFGNVLGSNGSVIPLFKKQIEHGGPVTLTNKYITRFFMTIPEAAQLVLQAGAYAKGGEIFVLDMGKPVKIYDLAWDLIKLSGFEPNKDIKIEITGLRPGEKLYEELLMSE